MHTFEARLLGEMECCMFPCNGVFAVTSMWAAHLVERGHFVSLSEVPDSFSHCPHISCDIVSLVNDIVWLPFREFPVLGVGTRYHYPDEDLGGCGSGDVNVPDGGRNGLVNNGFLHFDIWDSMVEITGQVDIPKVIYMVN